MTPWHIIIKLLEIDDKKKILKHSEKKTYYLWSNKEKSDS